MRDGVFLRRGSWSRLAERLLTLVRHGRTHANAGGLLQGHVDNELDEVGHDQASVLGPALARVAPVDRIIASPLLRAQQTASAIARHVGLAVETDRRWIELDYGDYDGQPMSSIPPEVWARWRSEPDFRPPRGESMAELETRVHGALVDLAANDTGLHVVVVSHVSPIKAAVAWALGVDIGVSWRTALDRASMSTIRLHAERSALVTFNVTVHPEK
jgi:probable phosphoglycerate mutase